MTAETITVTLTRREADDVHRSVLRTAQSPYLRALAGKFAPPPPPEPVEREGWVVYRLDSGRFVAGPFDTEDEARNWRPVACFGGNIDFAIRLIRWTDPAPEPEPAAERWAVIWGTDESPSLPGGREDALALAREWLAKGTTRAWIARLEPVEPGNG